MIVVPKATLGRIVLYRTDGRNGLAYDLPAIITCTKESHPGDYPDGKSNPLPVPESDTHVHLTVFTPGGFGSRVPSADDPSQAKSEDFVGATTFIPGSGTYVEWNVPLNEFDIEHGHGPHPRTWRWPQRV
jgi:hypothetical protein